MIVGALGAVLVGAFVVDQLGLVGFQDTQFQAAFGGVEEGIFLRDDLDGRIAQRFGAAGAMPAMSWTRALISMLVGIGQFYSGWMKKQQGKEILSTNITAQGRLECPGKNHNYPLIHTNLH